MTKRRLVAKTFLLGAALAVAFGLGVVTHRYRLVLVPDFWVETARNIVRTPGRWGEFRPPGGLSPADQAMMIEQLEAIGYVGGREEAPDAKGVTIHDPSRAQPGLNLFSSGHASEAYLMNMEGDVLHEWRRDIVDIWPDENPSALRVTLSARSWGRLHLYENGDLLGLYEGIGIFKLDKDSNLIWANRCGAHHDFDIAEDGTIYVLTREARVVERRDPEKPILEDFITVLTPDGEIVRRISILESFENSPYAASLDAAKPVGDVFHTNTLDLVRRSTPIARPGQVLVSPRNMNVIALVDLAAESVVWAMSGMWFRQHQPSLLANDKVLVFDNLGNGGRSKVIEFDPLSQQVSWSYGLGPGEDLFSQTLGDCARLPNGNTLITESDNGRAIEVTPTHEIVWEFISPHRAGPEDNLIATIPEVARLAPTFPVHWISPPKATARREKGKEDG